LHHDKYRRKKPIKEVVKEVPVDKVVFRDKIVEVLKKEIVHVPLYTNDKELIHLSNTGYAGTKKNKPDEAS
jgi:hypothetical protein